MGIRNIEALLAEITASQWGMVTTAQAERVGISRLVLARLNEQALLDRLLEIAGLDNDSVAKRLIRTPGLGESLRKALAKVADLG